MSKRIKGVLIVVFLLLIVPIASADDGYSELGAGGLVFSKTDSISMDKEVLEISPDRVTVSYTFKNLTSKGITAMVAFPLPSIKCGWFDRSTYPDRFTTIVNNVVIKPEVEIRAFIRTDLNGGYPSADKLKSGEEVTKLLKHYGLPADCRQVTPAPPGYRKITPNYRRVVALGLAAPVDPSTDPYEIFYESHIKYYWKQTFPAHSVIHISHAYDPAYGLSHDKLPRDYYPSYFHNYERYRKFFSDQPRLRDFKTNAAGGGYRIIDFILKSAGSWAGPIRNFKLVLKQPQCFVVTSLNGPLRMKGNNIVIELNNYEPTNDLKVFYASPDRDSICADGKAENSRYQNIKASIK